MPNQVSERCRHPTRHEHKSNSKLKLPPLADRKISKALATSINKSETMFLAQKTSKTFQNLTSFLETPQNHILAHVSKCQIWIVR